VVWSRAVLAWNSVLCVVGTAADQVVGIVQHLGHQGAHMPSVGSVDHVSALAVDGDQASQAQFGQVLGDRSTWRLAALGERGHVVLAPGEDPQQAQPSGVGEQTQQVGCGFGLGEGGLLLHIGGS
jgi:hypothetical protein